jgi:hypothetical protein
MNYARNIASFLLAFPLGILWLLGFMIVMPLTYAWRLDERKACEDIDNYVALLGSILRWVRGDQAK